MREKNLNFCWLQLICGATNFLLLETTLGHLAWQGCSSNFSGFFQIKVQALLARRQKGKWSKGGAGQRCAVDGGMDWSSLCPVLQPWPPAPWVFLVKSSSWHHLKTFFLPVWLVLLNLCAVEGSGNDAGGHRGYQVHVLKHPKGQGGCVQYFLAMALAGRARFLAPCWGWLPAVGWLPAATPQQNASPAS